MEKNNILPIGSVVMLKNAKKKAMIIGFEQKLATSDKIFDYCACVYPIGVIDSDRMLVFDHKDIDIIYSYGYQDEEFFEMINEKI